MLSLTSAICFNKLYVMRGNGVESNTKQSKTIEATGTNLFMNVRCLCKELLRRRYRNNDI